MEYHHFVVVYIYIYICDIDGNWNVTGIMQYEIHIHTNDGSKD